MKKSQRKLKNAKERKPSKIKKENQEVINYNIMINIPKLLLKK